MFKKLFTYLFDRYTEWERVEVNKMHVTTFPNEAENFVSLKDKYVRYDKFKNEEQVKYITK